MHMLAGVKAVKVGASSIAAVLSFSIGELITGHAGLAAFFALVSAVLAAWLATRPALMRERNQKELTEEERNIRFLHGRIHFHSQQVVLVRESKHKQAGYIETCHGWIRNAQARCPELPPFQFKYYDDLCGDEDRAMAALVLPSDIHATAGMSGEHPRGG